MHGVSHLGNFLLTFGFFSPIYLQGLGCRGASLHYFRLQLILVNDTEGLLLAPGDHFPGVYWGDCILSFLVTLRHESCVKIVLHFK